LTADPAAVASADDVDLVIELVGGEEPARTLIAAALERGRPVVTANKRVLARHGPQLARWRAARESSCGTRRPWGWAGSR